MMRAADAAESWHRLTSGPRAGTSSRHFSPSLRPGVSAHLAARSRGRPARPHGNRWRADSRKAAAFRSRVVRSLWSDALTTLIFGAVRHGRTSAASSRFEGGRRARALQQAGGQARSALVVAETGLAVVLMSWRLLMKGFIRCSSRSRVLADPCDGEVSMPSAPTPMRRLDF